MTLRPRLAVVAALFALASVAGWLAPLAVLAQDLPDCATPSPSDVQEFSGTSSAVTDPFVLPAGVFVVAGSYDGDENFIVHAFDEAGNQEFLINEIGPFTGETTLQIAEETRVILNIDANNGPWELSVSPAF